MSATTPPCGMADCSNRAIVADHCGVGFCAEHEDCGVGPTSADFAFDPWWAAASLATEAGDMRFENLEHGQWPEGMDDV